MNKKGDVAVLLLVLLVLIITAIAFFIFLTDSKRIEKELVNPKILDSVYFKEEMVKFYIAEAGRSAMKEKREGEDFKEKFAEKFEAYSFEEDYLKELKNRIEEGDFEVVEEADSMKIILENFSLRIIKEKVGILYQAKIVVEIKKQLI